MKAIFAAILACGVIVAAAPVVLHSLTGTETTSAGDNVRLGAADK